MWTFYRFQESTQVSLLEIKNNYGRTMEKKIVSMILQHHRLGENIPQSIQKQSITI